jgi:hypothetical protein
MVPTLVDASTKPLIETLDTLAKAEAGATFVPGHGEARSGFRRSESTWRITRRRTA